MFTEKTRILFPFNPIDEKQADGPFHDEYLILKQNGIKCALFDYDALQINKLITKPRLVDGENIVYRGWMLSPSLYEKLALLVEAKGGGMLTHLKNYIYSHHITQWYNAVSQYTPESIFIENEAEIIYLAKKTGWKKFFVKDYVKSNSSTRGSVANSPGEIKDIIQLIRKHRGQMEGGIALRKFEDFIENSEVRYFVFHGKAFSSTGKVPPIVEEIAKCHDAPFYSLDMAQRADGKWRLIEIGDGQVSDRKNWPAEIFCKMLTNKR